MLKNLIKTIKGSQKTKAIWLIDYDYHTDECFLRPMCKHCEAPVESDGRCLNCGQECDLTEEMKTWLRERSETKVKTEVCLDCGKPAMKTTYVKNPVTLEWQAAYGVCECGCRFIV